MAKRSWSDLTTTQQTVIVAGGLAETAATAYSLFDLSRRDRGSVRGGSKLAWLPVVFVQPVGPLAYLLWGRR